MRQTYEIFKKLLCRRSSFIIGSHIQEIEIVKDTQRDVLRVRAPYYT